MKWDILGGLTEDDARAVIRVATRRKFERGDTLFHQGDPGDSVHLLAKGHVAVKVVSRGGDVLTVDVMEPGDAFGEQAILAPESRRTASVVAIRATETLMLRRSDFEAVRAEFPLVTDMLVRLLASQVRRLSVQLLEAHTLSADERLVNRLHGLAMMFGDGSSASIPLSQQELATLAGTTRPTANRALQPLVGDGIVSLDRGRIVVHDIERLPTTAV